MPMFMASRRLRRMQEALHEELVEVDTGNADCFQVTRAQRFDRKRTARDNRAEDVVFFLIQEVANGSTKICSTRYDRPH
ncbi:MAG: hypothetical protein ACYC6N_08600 [Pirellulaceae bacterium]